MDAKITRIEIFLALSVSTLLKNDVPERLLFLLFLLLSSAYCGTFLYIESGFFFDSPSPPSIQLHHFFLKRELKLLNPACNISAVILVGPTSHLFILKTIQLYLNSIQRRYSLKIEVCSIQCNLLYS